MSIDLAPPQVAGIFLIACISILIGWFFLRKQPKGIKLFAIALLAVGLGYLATTNVPTSIVRTVFGEQY